MLLLFGIIMSIHLKNHQILGDGVKLARLNSHLCEVLGTGSIGGSSIRLCTARGEVWEWQFRDAIWGKVVDQTGKFACFFGLRVIHRGFHWWNSCDFKKGERNRRFFETQFGSSEVLLYRSINFLLNMSLQHPPFDRKKPAVSHPDTRCNAGAKNLWCPGHAGCCWKALFLCQRHLPAAAARGCWGQGRGWQLGPGCGCC